MKQRFLLLGLLLAAAAAPALAQRAQPRFVAPRPDQVVGGDYVLLWAAEPPAERPRQRRRMAKREVVFEASTDNRRFRVLPQQNAPDFGLFSRTSAFDTTQFPSGPLYLRVRSGNRRRGPTVRVRVDRLPVLDCRIAESAAPAGKGHAVSFDCAGSRDPDGRIVAYHWDFGDGTTLETDEPRAVHAYASPGAYPFELTAIDDLGLSATLLRIAQVAPKLTALQEREKCACEKMTVKAKGNSVLRDRRRPMGGGFAPAPLGKDPAFVTFNFEVTAELEAGSDPALCEEGQLVRRTAKYGGFPPEHKAACTAGRSLANCVKDSNCNSRTCDGGLRKGQPCEMVGTREACQVGGGRCVENNDGKCTQFPLAGAARGNDDYRRDFPGDIGPKLHCPACGTARWLDFPGAISPRAAVPVDVRYEADFLIFMKGKGGGGDCQCHVKLVLDWDGANQVYRPATGLSKVADAATTANCTVEN